MEQKFLNLVAEIMEEDRVTMDTRYKEGKWDSLMMLSLVMELEAEYGVSIPMESLGNVKTLADLYQLVI
jgi:acyl carrier protein